MGRDLPALPRPRAGLNFARVNVPVVHSFSNSAKSSQEWSRERTSRSTRPSARRLLSSLPLEPRSATIKPVYAQRGKCSTRCVQYPRPSIVVVGRLVLRSSAGGGHFSRFQARSGGQERWLRLDHARGQPRADANRSATRSYPTAWPQKKVRLALESVVLGFGKRRGASLAPLFLSDAAVPSAATSCRCCASRRPLEEGNRIEAWWTVAWPATGGSERALWARRPSHQTWCMLRVPASPTADEDAGAGCEGTLLTDGGGGRGGGGPSQWPSTARTHPERGRIGLVGGRGDGGVG